MPTFELQLAEEFTGKLPVYYLCKDGKPLITDFYNSLATDGNLSKQEDKLRDNISKLANDEGLAPSKGGQIQDSKYENIYEVKTQNLRLYLLRNRSENLIIIIGGKKTTQKADIKRLKQLINEHATLLAPYLKCKR